MEIRSINILNNIEIQDKWSFYFNSGLLFLVNGNTDATVLLSYCKQRQQMENDNQNIDADLSGSGAILPV